MHDVAVGVAEHLHLDVPGPGDDLLEQDAGISERRLRLALRALERGRKIRVALDQAHAASAAAGHGLDHHRVADALGLAGERFRFLAVAAVARHNRHAGMRGDRLGLGLAAHAAHGVGRGANELDAGPPDGFREVGILGEEPVARMDTLGLRLQGNGDDLVAAQVALGGRTRTDLRHLVRHPGEGRTAVGL